MEVKLINPDELNYKDHGFKIFRNVIDGVALKVIQEMFWHRIKDIVRHDNLPKDDQVRTRIPLGRISVGEAILHQMKHLIEQECGEEILCTYAYPVIYRPGSVLKRHIDRDACEFTATFTVLNLPEGNIWPIYAQGHDKNEIQVNMNPGDLCFYDGRNCDHWRDGLPDDCYNVSIFLHYVKKNGKFSEWHKREHRKVFDVDNVEEILNTLVQAKSS